MLETGRALKKILFFSNHLRGPGGSAGARSWHQARRLGAQFRVTVVIPSIDPVTAQPVTEKTYEGLNPKTVTVKKAALKRNDRSSLWRRIGYYLSAMPKQFWLGMTAERPVVVLSMGLPITTLLIAWLSTIRFRCKLVVDVRDLPFDMAVEIGYLRNRIVVAFLRSIESFLLRRAGAILTNSPRYEPLLVAKGVLRDKITVAYIGYDGFEEPPAVTVANWRRRMLMTLDPSTQMIAIYSGTLGHVVPVEEILEGARALKEDKRFGFVFLGDGQRLQAFKTFAQTNKLNAHFEGRVTKQEVMAACRAADICLYPAGPGNYASAILGNKVFDYLGADKLVFYIGEDSAVRDLLVSLDAGIFTPLRQPEEFAKNLLQLIDLPSEPLKYKGVASKLRARKLTASASADVLADVIETLVGQEQ